MYHVGRHEVTLTSTGIIVHIHSKGVHDVFESFWQNGIW